MKFRNLKPIVISALMAASFGATTIGTSFALFTDRADTKIEVTAGIVDIDIEYANLKAYSLDETDNTKLVEVTGGKFATKGTYELDETTGLVTLDRMVPGDKVEFDIKLTNKSNVKTKYRFAMSKSGALAPYLKASFGQATLVWTELEPASKAEGDLVNTAHVVIEFPNTTNEITVREEGYDNSAQGLSATYKLGYELVQGNAHTVDTAPAIAPTSVTANPVLNADDSKYYFNVATNDGLAMARGQAEDADPVKMTISTATDGNFSIEGAVSANYNITVENRMPGKEVTVSVYVGEGFETVYVFHEDETTPLSGVEYDAKTGYVTFKTSSFSPFHFAMVKEEMKFVTTAEELVEAAEEGGVIHIGADIDMGTTPVLVTAADTVIYGHDYKLMSKAARILRVQANVDLEIHNWDLYGQNVAERALQYDSNKEGDMYLDDVNIYGITMYTINFCSNTKTNLTVKNSYMEGWSAINLWTEGYTIDVDNCTFKGLNDKGYNAEGWNDFGIFVLEGDTTGASDLHASNNVCTIKNSTFIADATTGNKQYILCFNEQDANNEVYMTNCSFETRVNGVLEHDLITYTDLGNNKLVVDGKDMPAQCIIGSGQGATGGVENPPLPF